MYGSFHCHFFFVVAKDWKHPYCLLVGYLLNKLWHTDTMRYSTAVKKNVPNMRIWKVFKHTSLFEKSRVQTVYSKTTFCVKGKGIKICF